MLNKSRYQGVTSSNQHDISSTPYGASLEGPYKRWIPQSEPLLSESETEAPKRKSTRHSRVATSVQAVDTVAAPPPPPLHDHSTVTQVSATRNHTSSSARYYASASQQYRSERSQYGYSSESTIHAPATQSSTKPSSSGFGFFRPHIKGPKVVPADAHKHEELRRSAATPTSARPSQSQSVTKARSNPRDATTGAAATLKSVSTPSSANPSPRSSTDGHQNGNVSTPQIDKREARRHTYSTYNGSSRKLDSLPSIPSSRRTDKKTKDKEDMVAKVTEALGGGSTGRARDVEIAMLQTMKEDDAVVRRTTSSVTTTKSPEGSNRIQAQTLATPHRQKLPPPSNLHGDLQPSIPEAPLRSSREDHSRLPDSRTPGSTSRAHLGPIPMSRTPHLRTTASPWPFNQALPVESMVTKQSISGSSSAPLKPVSRASGVSTSSKPPIEMYIPPEAPDVRSIDRTAVSKEKIPLNESGRGHASLHPSTKFLTRLSDRYFVSQKALDNDKYTPRIWRDLPSLPAHDSGRGVSGAPQSTKLSSKAPVTAVPTQDVAKLKVDGDLLWSPPAEQSKHASLMKAGTMSNNLQTPRPVKRPTPPDTLVGMSTSDELYVQDVDAQLRPANERLNGHRRVESSPQVTWPTAKESTTVPAYPADEQPPLHQTATSSLSNAARMSQAIPGKSMPHDQSAQTSHTSHVIWQPPARHQSSTRADMDSVGTWTTTVKADISSASDAFASLATQKPSSSTSDAFASFAAQKLSSSTSDAFASLATQRPFSSTSDAFASLATQKPSSSNPPTPPTTDSLESTKFSLTAGLPTEGAWTTGMRSTAGTYDDISTPTPPSKFSQQAGHNPFSSPANNGSRYQSTSTSATNPPVAGAWTISNRPGTSAISIFDSDIPETKLEGGPVTSWNGFNVQDTALGTATPAVGAWTIKASSTEQPRTSSTSTPRPSPPRNSATPSPVPKLSTQDAGTKTGTSTPSSAEFVSPAVLQSTSDRVPISGHPSTPAPMRHTLRPTPPPLSFSSTSPDTDSLLTPSSLNSPRSTLLFAQSQPSSAVSMSTIQPPEKEKKGGFLDFFRPKPPVYEIWTPPTRGKNDKDKERKLEPEYSKGGVAKPKNNAVPSTPKSPKFFKLFSRRRRTVSSASLDALDGTTTAILNSPASSMRADPPGAPPSPPIRDAFLATEEWRNKEDYDLQISGRRRRPRPGVTFDCPEDIAPANVVPKRYRGSRSPAPEVNPYDDDD